jgi:hypothetical protein
LKESIRAAAMQDMIQQILAMADNLPPVDKAQPCCSQSTDSKNKNVKDCKKYANKYPNPIGRKLMECQYTALVKKKDMNPPTKMARNAIDRDA